MSKEVIASNLYIYAHTHIYIFFMLHPRACRPTKICIVKAMVFPESCMDVRVGLYRKLSTEELMLLNCGVGEDS